MRKRFPFFTWRKRKPTDSQRHAISSLPNTSSSRPLKSVFKTIGTQIRNGNDPFPIILKTIAPLSEAQKCIVLARLGNHFCLRDQDFHSLFTFANNHNVPVASSNARINLRLPYLLLTEQFHAVREGMWQIANQEPFQYTPTIPVAWTARQVLTADIPSKLREDILRGFLAICTLKNKDRRPITHCEELTRAAADILRSDTQWKTDILRIYGLSTVFWEYLAKDTPHELDEAHRHFSALRQAETLSDVEPALAFFERINCGDAPRVRKDLTPVHIKTAMSLSVSHESNAEDSLTLLSPPEKVLAAQNAEVAVVLVVYNEMHMLPHFLAHYRNLGVDGFLIADNSSDDGTRDYLLEQPDVALFSANGSWKQALYGVRWQQTLLGSFRTGKWSLIADADELLTWQHPQEQTLPELLTSPNFQTANAARIFMVDMYPRGPISQTNFQATPPFEIAPYCDNPPILANSIARGPYSNSPSWTSAVRHRNIHSTKIDQFMAQKYALLRYHPFMHFSEGLHYATGIKIAPQNLIFNHFKFHAEFYNRVSVETARNQRLDNANEFAKLQEISDVLFSSGVSEKWHECLDLL